MRFKLVPPAPESLDAVADAQRAVPLVPASEDEAVARLLRSLSLRSRDVARTWLTFLRALELVRSVESGFVRTRADPTPDHLRTAFRTRVFGVEELLSELDASGESLSADESFEAIRARVPPWEHFKQPTEWESRWRDRTETLLEWSVLLGLAVRDDGGGGDVDDGDDEPRYRSVGTRRDG